MGSKDRLPEIENPMEKGEFCARAVMRILDSLDGIVFVSDLRTNLILYANQYLKELFGFDPTGRNCKHLLYSPHSDGDFTENDQLIDKDGKPAGVLYREYQNPFNKKWYGAKVQALEWEKGEYVRLEIAIDITEEKQLRSFLDEARKQAAYKGVSYIPPARHIARANGRIGPFG